VKTLLLQVQQSDVFLFGFGVNQVPAVTQNFYVQLAQHNLSLIYLTCLCVDYSQGNVIKRARLFGCEQTWRAFICSIAMD
jgi:hypothetical protein